MTPPLPLTSPTHLTTLVLTHPLLIIDFHATWCSPCHAIAPYYTTLSTTHSSPARILFTKCDVDAQPEIAGKYTVTAMPTFLFLVNGREVARVRGADRAALGREVGRWVGEVGGGKGAGGGFGGGGKVLGGDAGEKKVGTGAGAKPTTTTTYIRHGQPRSSIPLDARVRMSFDWLLMVFVLYFTSLISLDPMGACEGVAPGSGGGGGRGGWMGAVKGFFGGGGGPGGPGGPGGGPPPRGGAGGRKLGGMDTLPGGGRAVQGVNTGSCCG